MKRKPFKINGQEVKPGETRDFRLKISETYTGDEVCLPVRVARADRPGPALFVTAAIHGDEVNGTGIIHDLMFGEPLVPEAGTLVLLPVVNVFGFEGNTRYLPDRRDLNRSFPGASGGSLASRLAKTLMEEVVEKCQFGIDLHSAAFQRTNFPNIRGDLRDPGVRRIARAFGCALVVDGKGPEGSLRRAACQAGVPTIILEAGEPWKIEPAVLQIGVRGIRNVMRELGMLAGPLEKPPYQATIRKTVWLRAQVGGILKFHISPGDIVEKDQPIATNYSIMGTLQNILRAPADGIALSIATMPAVKPGEPVCHLAVPTMKIATIRAAMNKAPSASLHEWARRDLATSIVKVPG